MDISIASIYLIHDPNDIYHISASQDVSHQKEIQDFVDVVVYLKNGEIYTTTFFTLPYITHQLEKLSYFWEQQMVLVHPCAQDDILQMIKKLMQVGDFFEVFDKL